MSSCQYLTQTFASMALRLFSRGFKNGCKWLWNHRNYLIIAAAPLVFLPLPLVYPEPVSVCECVCCVQLQCNLYLSCGKYCQVAAAVLPGPVNNIWIAAWLHVHIYNRLEMYAWNQEMVDSWLIAFLHLSPGNSLSLVCCLYESTPDCVCVPRRRAVVIMALYSCTECMSLAVTSLLPVVLFPMMGIMKAEEVLVPVGGCTFFFGETKHTGAENCRLLSKETWTVWICVRSCFRSALSIWRTQTCCSLVECWWPSRWRNGTFTSASLSEFCVHWYLSVSVRSNCFKNQSNIHCESSWNKILSNETQDFSAWIAKAV